MTVLSIEYGVLYRIPTRSSGYLSLVSAYLMSSGAKK